MAQAVLLPKLGQTVVEATIVKWHKSEGDAIAKGDIIFEIETDKAVLEVESFYEGTLLKIYSLAGSTLPVSSTVGYIGDKGEKVPDAPPAPPKPEPTSAPAPAAKPAPADKKPAAPAAATPETATAVPAPIIPAKQRLFISPRAKKLAADKAIDPSKISGSGPSGRIVVKDVTEHLETSGYNELKISPAALKLAVKEKVDILSSRRGLKKKRVAVADVKDLIAEKPKPLSKMRQVIADRLTRSFRDIPHFYVTVSIDMTDLLAFRAKLKKAGANYSVNDFILRAVAGALEKFPAVNSSTDGKSVSWRSTVDLGMAVSLEDGLVVPVIHDAGNLSMDDLHDTAVDLATRARDGKLLPDEMTGSSFTVSNMGMLGVDDFCAIINPGEAAILAVAAAKETPVAVNGKVKIRSIMKVTLSADHRIIDGVMGGQFLNEIKETLENIELWKKLV